MERSRRPWSPVERQRFLQYTLCIYSDWELKGVFLFNWGAPSRSCKLPSPGWSVSRHCSPQITQTEEQRVSPHALTFPQKWLEKWHWLHSGQVQCFQRKTAKSRGSPFLCCLEFPSWLWKWIKFMSSMKQSKSSSSSLGKETLILFLLQFSSARTTFIGYICHMHFPSRTSLGENQDITFFYRCNHISKVQETAEIPFHLFCLQTFSWSAWNVSQHMYHQPLLCYH